MKKVNLREWKDLTDRERSEAIERRTGSFVEAEMEMLNMELEDKQISEDAYYERLGCSKVYAETTAWFVPSCYYDKNKKEIDEIVLDDLEESVFDANGHEVYVGIL